MTEQEYNDYADMFATDGWKQFIGAVEELNNAISTGSVDSATTNDQWQYTRGQVHQLRSIIGYENYIKAAWEQQKEDESDSV